MSNMDLDIVDFVGKSNRLPRSRAWDWFGFPSKDGFVDKTNTICKLCRKMMSYNGNTSNMMSHLDRNHWNATRGPDEQRDVTLTRRSQSNSSPTIGSVSTPPQVVVNTPTAMEIARKVVQLEKAQNPSKFSSVARPLQPQFQPQFPTWFEGPMSQNVPRVDDITKSIADFLSTDLMPIQTVDGEGFKNLLNTIEPRYSVPSSSLIFEKHLDPMYQTLQAKTKQALESAERHAFTVEEWNNYSNHNFVTISAHFVNPETFDLEKVVLKTIHTPFIADNLTHEMQSCIEEWELKNPIGLVYKSDGLKQALHECSYPRLECLAQSFNQVVNACLDIPGVLEVILKCRHLVEYVCHSNLDKSSIQGSQYELKLKEIESLDHTDQQWTSALALGQGINYMLPTLVNMLAQNDEYCHLILSEQETGYLKDLIAVLTPFEAVTKILASDKKPTASLILPLIHTVLSRDCRTFVDDSPLISQTKTVIRSMLEEKYRDDFQQATLQMASLLDPRFKSLPWMNDRRHIQRRLLDEAHPEQDKPAHPVGMFHKGNVKMEPFEDGIMRFDDEGAVNGSEDSSNGPAAKKSRTDASATPSTPEENFFDKVFSNDQETQKDIGALIQMEVANYLALPNAPASEHPLAWWKNHRSSFPYLSKLAVKYLCIPATAIPSEMLFLAPKLKAGVRQKSSLSAKEADMMLFLNGNSKLQN